MSTTMAEPQLESTIAPVHVPRPFTRRSWILLACMVLVAAWYAGQYLRFGWFPHDEGAFALTAEHVLHGEVPHRDFDEIYTGGLSYVNAGAMRLFGENMVAMRYPIYAVFLAWVAAVFLLARRFLSDVGAALLALLLIAISYPNYTAAAPSWYNLFLATFGILALFRFMEGGRLRWIFICGVLGGLSFLIKVSGLYFVAAALCFLLFREQEEDAAETSTRVRLLPFVILALGVVFVLQVWKTIAWHIHPRFIFHFIVPSALIIATLVQREFKGHFISELRRLRRLVQLTSVLLAGTLLPVALYLVPYIRSGALHSFLSGVFVLPIRRAWFAAYPPEGFDNLLASGALVALLVYGVTTRWGSEPRWLRNGLRAFVIFALVAAYQLHPAYHILWSAVTLLVPLSVFAVVLWFDRLDADSVQRQRLFLLTACLGICGLIRFPFASPIYLLYVLPLVPLVWIAMAATRPQWSRLVFGMAGILYGLFFFVCVTPSFITNMGIRYKPLIVERWDDARVGGLRVPAEDRKIYEQIVQLVAQHSHSDYIYAAPDCPQIYFLTNKRQPDRVMFDFFDEDRTAHRERILSALDEHKVDVAVILNRPAFSYPLEPRLRAELIWRYPEMVQVGDFEVRWAW